MIAVSGPMGVAMVVVTWARLALPKAVWPLGMRVVAHGPRTLPVRRSANHLVIVVRSSVAEIVFDRDAVLWLGGPPLLSLAVVLAGALARRSRSRAGVPLLVLGLGGLLISGAWIALAFYVDAVVQ